MSRPFACVACRERRLRFLPVARMRFALCVCALLYSFARGYDLSRTRRTVRRPLALSIKSKRREWPTRRSHSYSPRRRISLRRRISRRSISRTSHLSSHSSSSYHSSHRSSHCSSHRSSHSHSSSYHSSHSSSYRPICTGESRQSVARPPLSRTQRVRGSVARRCIAPHRRCMAPRAGRRRDATRASRRARLRWWIWAATGLPTTV